MKIFVNLYQLWYRYSVAVIQIFDLYESKPSHGQYDVIKPESSTRLVAPPQLSLSLSRYMTMSFICSKGGNILRELNFAELNFSLPSNFCFSTTDEIALLHYLLNLKFSHSIQSIANQTLCTMLSIKIVQTIY